MTPRHCVFPCRIAFLLAATSGVAAGQDCARDVALLDTGFVDWPTANWAVRTVPPPELFREGPPLDDERALFNTAVTVQHADGSGAFSVLCGMTASDGADAVLVMVDPMELIGDGLSVRSASSMPSRLRIEPGAASVGVLRTPSVVIDGVGGSAARLHLAGNLGTPASVRFTSNGIGNSQLTVGLVGTGHFDVAGDVQTEPGALVDVVLGGVPGASGTLSVFGGALCALDAETFVIGDFGRAALSVQNSVLSTSTPFGHLIAAGDGSTGDVLVTAGGRWSAVGSPIVVGGGGSGSLRVFGPSDVSAANGVVAGPTGSVELNGLVIGDLTLAGGLLRVFDRSGEFPGLEGTLAGNLAMSGVDAQTGESRSGRLGVRVASIGEVSPGVFDVEASHLMADAARLDGTLHVEASADLSPSPGLVVPILTTPPNATTGAFSGVVSPAFGNGTRFRAVVTDGGVDLVAETVSVERRFAASEPIFTDLPAGRIVEATSIDLDEDRLDDLILLLSHGQSETGTVVVLQNLGPAPQGDGFLYEFASAFESGGVNPVAIVSGGLGSGGDSAGIAVLHRGDGSPDPTLPELIIFGAAAAGFPNAIDPVPLEMFGIRGRPTGIDVADLNEDGWDDLIVSSSDDLGDPAGFAIEARGSGVPIALSASRGAPHALSAGGSGAVTLLVQAESGFDFDETDTGDPSGVSTVQSMAPEPDIVVVTVEAEDVVEVYEGDGSGGLVEPFLDRIAVGDGPREVRTGDLTGDGIDDIVTANVNDGTVSILLATAPVDPSDPPTYGGLIGVVTGTPALSAAPRELEIVDYDEDGDMDIAVIAVNGGAVEVRLIPNDGFDEGTSTLSLGAPVTVTLPVGAGDPEELTVADGDADEDDDLIIGFEEGSVPALAVVAFTDCAADLASPLGILNSSDVNAFVSAFLNTEAAADLASPEGIWNSSDINAFVASFLAGCP